MILNPYKLSNLKKYFMHQKELYGDTLYLQQDVLKQLAHLKSDSLNALKQIAETCVLCPLSKHRRQVVFGAGDTTASLMLIGDHPGEEDDATGQPFSGEAGDLLDKMLQAIGFSRDEIYMAHAVKCRGEAGRGPVKDEINTCVSYLKQQIDAVQPKMMLALGRLAAQTILETQENLNQLRGQFYEYKSIPLLISYHPAALLKNPGWKRPAWEDLKKLRLHYDQVVGDKAPWKHP